MTSRKFASLFLIFTLLVHGDIFAGNLEDAKRMFWWTSVFTLMTAASVLASTVILTSMIQMSSDNINQNSTLPYQSKKFKNILNVADAAAGMAALEVLIPIGIFVLNEKHLLKEAAALSMFYFAPAVLNTALMGWALQSRLDLCDMDTPCWQSPACSVHHSCSAYSSFNAMLVCWAVIRPFAYIAPLFSMCGAGCATQ
ncbi:MAG: hypothetical protein WCK49_06705 [Myxococcaceae bacterium]